jgi:single-stranded-DNA-specific exonuclease
MPKSLDRINQWTIRAVESLPDVFIQTVATCLDAKPGPHTLQLLWQRGIRTADQLAGFLHPDRYQATDPLQLGEDVQWAVERLQQAERHHHQVVIWGDFDADGITATAVLWEGLGRIFTPYDQLRYYIPNRLTESHGLSQPGIEHLKSEGCQLIVTCDTGSSNVMEIAHARQLGIDVIITDHHTLPIVRPPATAIINPRSLPRSHPLAHLSGVAVAYKLIEALYLSLDRPQADLDALLDLVAIGLIADLVELTGDCRHLAQRGIQRLQQLKVERQRSPRPGVTCLLDWCKRSGDRPTDVSFGIGPRINAISRIHGDAHFAVQLLTSREVKQCEAWAEQAELANSRRKGLQRQLVQQITDRLTQLDLSTTHVIVLSDDQWPTGILGLVAGQIAQTYGRPTILLSTEPIAGSSAPSGPLARGSARSVASIDLYQLVQGQEHLLHRFGGHPLAMGLSLVVDNIPLFTDAINRQLRQIFSEVPPPTIQVDLVVTVAELRQDDGRTMFRQLKLLEPYGMGNPVPKLLVKSCEFTNLYERQTLPDLRKQLVRLTKTEFAVKDDSAPDGFPGVWWGHGKDEIPQGCCDAIFELDFNTYENPKQGRKARYELRLIDVQSIDNPQPCIPRTTAPLVLDWRPRSPNLDSTPQFQSDDPVLVLEEYPTSWDELQEWYRHAEATQQPLAIAFPNSSFASPVQVWQELIGIAKYLSRTGTVVSRSQLHQRLGVSDQVLSVGLQSLQALGFTITFANTDDLKIKGMPTQTITLEQIQATFLRSVQEEQFRQQYFREIPISILQQMMTMP